MMPELFGMSMMDMICSMWDMCVVIYGLAMLSWCCIPAV